MSTATKLSRVAGLTLLGGLSIILAGEVHAYERYADDKNSEEDFSGVYPNSTSYDTAGCALCHGSKSSTNILNRYGAQLVTNGGGTSFSAVEALCSANSNVDPSFNCNDGTSVTNGTSNLDEINANSQPGWTNGSVNEIYDLAGALQSINNLPPVGIGDLDPNQPPTADPGGPYNGILNVAITFDGSGSFDPDGWFSSRIWDFGDGNTGWGENPTHAYLAAGEYTVTLTVTDNDGDTDSDTTTVTIPAWSYGGDSGSWKPRRRGISFPR